MVRNNILKNVNATFITISFIFLWMNVAICPALGCETKEDKPFPHTETKMIKLEVKGWTYELIKQKEKKAEEENAKLVGLGIFKKYDCIPYTCSLAQCQEARQNWKIQRYLSDGITEMTEKDYEKKIIL
jgi:hypothetical protein